MSTLVAAPFREAALPLASESIAGSSRRPDPGFLRNEPAELKHPSLRIAYFSAVSRHVLLREADELQAVCTNVRVFFSGRPFFRIQEQISDFPGALLGIFSSGMI